MRKILVFSCFLFINSVFALEIEREIQVCNFVTQYLCILEDFQGKGYMRVRREVQENLNTRGIQPETKRLVRRLIDACDLAESTLQNIEYTNEDSGDKTLMMWGSNIGASSAASFLVGDPTPLLIGVSNAVIEHNKLGKEKRRAIDIQMRTFNQMLNRYHMEVNERRNDLVDEHGVSDNKFIRRSTYKDFLNCISRNDDEAINTLYKITLEYPFFREAWYMYGEKLYKQKEYSKAFNAYSNIISNEYLIVRNDGLKGKALTEMGACQYKMRKREALNYFKQACSLVPSYARLHLMMSYHYNATRAYEDSLASVNKALELNPNLVWGLHHKAELQLILSHSEEKILDSIEAALKKGLGPEYFFDNKKYASQKMCQFMAKDENIVRFAPKITAKLKYGFFDDDIILHNTNPYSLTDVKITVKIHPKEEKTFRTNNGIVERTYDIAKIRANGDFRIADVFSICDDAPVDLEIIYSLNQSPAKWKWESSSETFERYFE